MNRKNKRLTYKSIFCLVILIIPLAFLYFFPTIPKPYSFLGNVFRTNENVRDVATSPNSNYIIAACSDDSVYFLDDSSFSLVWSYKTTGSVNRIAFSNNGDYAAASSYGSAGSGGYLYLFNLTTPNISLIYVAYVASGMSINSIAISPNGTYIAVGTTGYPAAEIIFYNSSSSIPMWSYPVSGTVHSIDISNDGKYLAGGGEDGGIHVFNMFSSIPVWSYSTSINLESVLFSKDSKYLVVGSRDLYKFNILNFSLEWSYVFGWCAFSITISDDNRYVAAVGEILGYHGILLLDTTIIGNSLIWSYSIGATSGQGLGPYVVEFSPDNNYIIMGGNYFGVYIFEKSISKPYAIYSIGTYIRSIEFVNSNNFIIIGGAAGIHFLDFNSIIVLTSYILPFIFNLVVFLIVLTIILTIYYYVKEPFKKQRNLVKNRKVEEQRSLRQLELLIRDIDKISLEKLRSLLRIDEASFNRKIFEWAPKYGLIIDGEHLIVNEDKVSDFINVLDDHFKKWEKMEKQKIKKK